MDTATRAAMIEAATVLRDVARFDQVRISVLNAAHANNVSELERHIEQCRDLARTLHVAASREAHDGPQRLSSAS